MRTRRLIQYLSFSVLIFLSVFLISCTILSSNFSKSFTSYIYTGSRTRDNYLTTYYVKGKGNIPYVSTANAYSLLGYDVDVIKDDKQIKYTKLNGSYVIFDAEEDTIKFNNYFYFLEDDISNLIKSKSNKYVKAYTDEIKSDVKEYTIDLKKYDIDILSFNKSFYIPFQIINAIFLNPLNYNFSFNGSDYYLINDDVIFDEEGYLNSYGKYFYSSKEDKEVTEELALFNYNELVFEFENFYGAYDILGIDSFDKYITDLNLKEDLISTSVYKSTKAFLKLLASLNDCHTGYNKMSPYLFYETIRDLDFYESSINNKSKQLSNRKEVLNMKRGREYSNSYYYSKDTMIISFDDFVLDFSLDYTFRSPSISDISNDNFALFYLAFEYIKNYKPNIKNVVIDLTLNGGGEVDSLLVLLAFICGKYEFTFIDTLTGSTYVIPFAADINLDGKVDSSDSYADEYNYYILTDSPTFSCANTFAAVAKANNAATIIGSKSSGGACIISNSSLANGTTYQKSGIISMVGKDDNGLYSIENGIDVDYPISDNYYYSPTMLRAALKLINIVA